MKLLPFILIVAYALQDDIPSKCPDGFVGHETSCFKLVEENASWTEARVYCASMGARLASITSQTGQDFLVNMIHGFIQTKALRNVELVWLDATELAEEGTWRWSGANSVVSFKAWQRAQPNNSPNVDGNKSNCMLMKGLHDFKWNDENCATKAHFLCEISLSADWLHGIIG